MPRAFKRIPLLIFSVDQMEKVGKRMEFIGEPLSVIHMALEDELRTLGIGVKPSWYAGSAFLSALIYALAGSGLFYALLAALERANLSLAGMLGVLFFLIAFLLHITYPSILTKKISDQENHELLFALREIVMNVKSGMTLFDAFKQVARGEYGYVSDDFHEVVNNIEAGMFEREALKQAALKSQNDYLARAIWQMVNAMDSGSSVADALTSIIDSLEKLLYRRIALYTANLNFIMLIYMLVAAAIPSVGTTFLILISVFSGAGIEKTSIMMLVGMSVVVEIVIIGYAHTTRPAVFGG